MQLHKILIGVVLMSVIVIGFLSFYSGGVSYYGVSDYNATELQAFNKSLYDIKSTTNETKSSLEGLQSKSGVLDIFGSLFSGAYSAAKTSVQSFGVLNDVISAGLRLLPLGGFGDVLASAIGTIVLIVFFIGILMHFITRSERT